ncbi:MAG: hypothetical protein R6W48_04055 [Gaiellaceae bacterium]
MTEIDTDANMPRGSGSSRKRALGIGAGVVVVIAVAAGLLVWLLLVRGDGAATVATPGTATVATSVDDLRELLATVAHPVYWAGPSETDAYEVTKTPSGNVFIRYLPEDAEAGDPRPRFTTIATYPSSEAFATLETGARRKDATVFRFESGALAVTYAKTPSSVFFAFPTSPYIVEVFDPSPARAVELVRSGQVEPIG